MPAITTINVPAGTIAYRESGDREAPVALYVHGVIVNSYLWRHQLEHFASARRNIAIDLLGHGHSRPSRGQGLTFTDQAAMIAQFLDAMNIADVDLVASDSGTGIAQIFAVKHPERVRSLVVTNGDVHDNWPPAAFKGFTDQVAAGQLPAIIEDFNTNHDSYRGPDGIGGAYQHPDQVTDEEIDAYITPLATLPGQVDALAEFINAFNSDQTTVLAEALTRLNVPTLIIWGTGDIFFDLTGARWLASTLPEAREPVILEDGALLLASERADEVNAAISAFWLRLDAARTGN